LFEQPRPEKPLKTRQDILRAIDADYYGYRDEDDGILLSVESEHEAAEGSTLPLFPERMSVDH
jgi:pre-mRNA-splicing factor ISY1